MRNKDMWSILNAQEDNAGRYSCVATNEAGEMIKHYEVKVYSKFWKNAVFLIFSKFSTFFNPGFQYGFIIIYAYP